MSEEWLKKLAELSNDKNLVKRAQQMQKRSAGRSSGGDSRRSLFSAAFGFWFRFLFLFGLAEAVLIFVFAGTSGETDASWGDDLRYGLWYILKEAKLPSEFYDGLQQLTGLTTARLAAAYDSMQPYLDQYRQVLVFAAPAALALALTLYFLPSINATRRRNPIRIIIFLANLAAGPLYAVFTGAPVVWFGAFILSFAGRGGLRLPKPPVRAPAKAPPPQSAHPTTGRTVVGASGGADHSARAVLALKREPTVVRRGGGSWVRPR